MNGKKLVSLAILCVMMTAVLPVFALAPNNVSVAYTFNESEILGWLDSGNPIKDLLVEAVSGEPLVPYRLAKILLPPYTDVASISVQTTLIRQHRVNDIPCGQPPCIYGEEPTIVPKNIAVYRSNDLYPKYSYQASSVDSFHGYKVVQVRLYPIHYMPASNTATYCTQMTIQVSLRSGGKMAAFSELAEERQMVASMVDNAWTLSTYDSIPADGGTMSTTYEYLIITNVQMLDEFQVLANWKAKWVNGARVETVSGSVTADQIKSIIRDYHTYYNTLYVLLGGDVQIIPYHTRQVLGDNIAEDYWFGNLHGTDDAISTYDVYIGRAPVDTEAEAANFVRKVISYEQMAKPTANLFHQSRVNSGNVPDSRQLPWQCEQYVPGGYTNYELFEENGRIDKPNWVSFWRNKGIICEHIGHGSPTSYYINYQVGGGSVTWYGTDVPTMDNTFWPVHTSVACHSGEFEYDDCLAEAYVKNDCGAIACLTNDKYGWYSYGDATMFSGDFIEMQFRSLFQDGHQKIGPMMAFAKYYFNDAATNPSNPNRAYWEYCWREINLLGDPETPLLTQRPSPPATPSTPSGQTTGYVYTPYTYTTSTTDPEGDNIYYELNWGDGTTSTVGPYASGVTASASHQWKRPQSYQVNVRAKDFDAWSGYSGAIPVTLGQNDAGSGGDAGNNQAGAVNVCNNGLTYYGTLYGSNPIDTLDFYNFTATSGRFIDIYMYPPSTGDFDLQLYDPAGNLRRTSRNNGSGVSEWIYFQADVTGTWSMSASWISGEGQYSFNVYVYSGGGGGCPYFYVYDGQVYVNEGLLNIHNADGIDVTTKQYLITTPKAVRGTYQFRLVEHPQTASKIDQVKLYAILEDRSLIPLPLVWARHSEDGNVFPQLLLSDDWRTEILGADHNNGVSQSIDLKFLALPPGFKTAGFLFVIEGNNMYVKTID